MDPRLGRRTFGEWAREWLETTTHLRPSSRARVEGVLRQHLLPRFDTRPLAGITPSEVRSLVSDLTLTGLAPASVRKVYNVLRPIFATAEEAGILSRSPCRGVKLPASDQRSPRFLSPEELARLAEAHPKRYRALILFAGYSGLRFGEVVGLRLERVDFLRSRVTVTDTIVEVAGRLHHGPTKTGRGRVVTLPRFVTEELARHLSAYPSHPEGLVFTAPEGGAIRRSAFRFRVFLPAIEEAGLERLRIHDLRHTAAALAIRAGAHPKAIQERLGHASVATTLNVYGHLFPALDEELAARLDDVARTAAGPMRDRDGLASDEAVRPDREIGP